MQHDFKLYRRPVDLTDHALAFVHPEWCLSTVQAIEQHQCVSSSVLIDINDTIVTSQMLDAIRPTEVSGLGIENDPHRKTS